MTEWTAPLDCILDIWSCKQRSIILTENLSLLPTVLVPANDLELGHNNFLWHCSSYIFVWNVPLGVSIRSIYSLSHTTLCFTVIYYLATSFGTECGTSSGIKNMKMYIETLCQFHWSLILHPFYVHMASVE
jgi:hypothetical protein